MPPSDAAWQQKLAALRAHVAAHGRLPPTSDAGLGGWVNNQRQGKKAMDLNKKGKVLGGMTPARAAVLEAVPGWAWELDLDAIWQEKLAALRAYVGVHGRLPVHGDPSGLGNWVHNQRQAKKAGSKCELKMTPTRAAALEAVPGWAWEVDVEAAWEQKLAALRSYVHVHGRLPPQRAAGGLGAWINNQRQAKKAMDAGGKSKKMTPARVAALEGVPGWAWDLEAAWQEKLAALRAYVAAHGRLPLRDNPSGLGHWVHHQQEAKKAADAGRRSKSRVTTPARVAALEAVPGWAWEVDLEAAWQERLAALQAFVAAHGRLPPIRHPSGMGSWIQNQRTAKKAMDAGSASDKMTPQRVAALEAVPGWAWEVDLEALWQERLAALRAHVAAHGRLPPQRDAAGLGAWVSTQRKAKTATDAGRKSSHKMTPARVAALEGVPGWAWDAHRPAALPAAPPAKRAKKAGL